MPRIPLTLLIVAVACTVQTSAQDPSRKPEPLVTSADGEVMGADRVPPSDRLSEGARVTLQPDTGEPVVVGLGSEYANRIEKKSTKRVELRDLRGKSPR